MRTATASATVPLEVSPWQRLLGMYLRWSNRNPGLASILPFVPVVLAWAAIARSGLFPPDSGCPQAGIESAPPVVSLPTLTQADPAPAAIPWTLPGILMGRWVTKFVAGSMRAIVPSA